jgi:hypothetical protein
MIANPTKAPITPNTVSPKWNRDVLPFLTIFRIASFTKLSCSFGLLVVAVWLLVSMLLLLFEFELDEVFGSLFMVL